MDRVGGGSCGRHRRAQGCPARKVRSELPTVRVVPGLRGSARKPHLRLECETILLSVLGFVKIRNRFLHGGLWKILDAGITKRYLAGFRSRPAGSSGV